MALVALILPTYVCNLACKYCYNEGDRREVMDRALLKRVVEQIHDYACAHPELGGVTYLWHGGEPLVAGLSFYQEAVAIQKGLTWTVPYWNAMQSNGTLIDADWIEFLKRESFRISFSLDGTKELNDATRVDHQGRGSYDKIVKAINMTREAGLQTGAVLTLTQKNAPHAVEIYEAFAEQGIRFTLLPLLKAGNAKDNMEELSLTPEMYLRAYTQMYDAWWFGSKHIEVQDFVQETKAVLSGRPYLCTGLANCADSTIAVEMDGKVSPCGSLAAHDALSYGSLADATLSELMQTSKARELRQREHHEDCKKCKWFHVCHGGCMSRAHKYTGTVHTKDYYCHALYGIYEHIEMRLQENRLKAAPPHVSHLDEVLGLPKNHQANPGKRRTIIPIVSAI